MKKVAGLFLSIIACVAIVSCGGGSSSGGAGDDGANASTQEKVSKWAAYSVAKFTKYYVTLTYTGTQHDYSYDLPELSMDVAVARGTPGNSNEAQYVIDYQWITPYSDGFVADGVNFTMLGQPSLECKYDGATGKYQAVIQWFASGQDLTLSDTTHSVVYVITKYDMTYIEDGTTHTLTGKATVNGVETDVSETW